MRVSAAVRRLWRTASILGPLDWWTAFEATGRLAWARAMVLLLRFPTLSKWLGTPRRESSLVDDPGRRAALRRVRWAIGAVSRRAPWRCKCLEQAIAAKMMLRARGMESTLYLGVARDGAREGHPVEAHAWLRCGSYYVTGGEERERFTAVSMFADEVRP